MDEKNKQFEVGRQWFHILFGTGLLIGSVLLGPQNTRTAYFVAMLIGLAILHLKLSGMRLPLIDPVLSRFERSSALFPGQGALMYFAGALFVLSFTPFHFALGAIAIVAFGDGFATLVGLYGKWKLPWSPKKTTEGLVAFILSAAGIAALVIPPLHALSYAIILGVLETADIPADDNLILPVAATVLYYLAPFAV
ncbi:hypothetical protein HY994_05005 [Candidatus Micrarchaeota archaeon]|nr:hypothetical protein [Candidatus Micrarchaeota archaeon]